MGVEIDQTRQDGISGPIDGRWTVCVPPWSYGRDLPINDPDSLVGQDLGGTRID